MNMKAREKDSPSLPKEAVYAVVMDPAGDQVDEEKTSALREEVRTARKKRGTPVKDYLAKEREKILSCELPAMAASCLNECLANSGKFQQQIRQFWDLDDSFTHISPKLA